VAFVGEQLGLFEGDWLGAVEANPGAMYANIGGSGSVSGVMRSEAADTSAPSGVSKKKPRRIHPRYIYEPPEELPERIREKKKLAAFIEKVLEPVPELRPIEFSAAWIESPTGIEDAMESVKRAEAAYRRAREIDEEDDLLLLMI
jgi:hypothetical protein